MKNPVQITGALRVEYRVRLSSLATETSLIESEKRVVGGNGGVAALALAQFGVPVRLQTGAIGDDAHGKFLLAELAKVQEIEHAIELRPGVVTPYAILIRDQTNRTQTLLSPEAAQLEGEPDYPALLESLRLALEEQGDRAQIERWVSAYDRTFGESSFLDAL